MVQFPASGFTQVLLYTLLLVAERVKLSFGKNKTRLIHINIKNKERTVIVKCFENDTVWRIQIHRFIQRPGITSDFYGPMNFHRGTVIRVIVTVNLLFCILQFNSLFGRVIYTTKRRLVRTTQQWQGIYFNSISDKYVTSLIFLVN